MIAIDRTDWRVRVAIVSGGHFLSHVYKLTLPPLFPLLRGEFGLTNTELGLLVTIVALGGLLQAPVGSVVDRVGAKRVFVAGVGVTGGGIALLGLGPTYPALLGLAVVTGIGQAAFHPADYAILEAVTDPDVRGRAFGVHTFSGYAGFAAAPIVVGAVGFTAGWRVALFAVGGVGLLYAAGAAVALVPAYRPAADATGAAAAADATSDRPLRSLLRPGLLAMVGFFLLSAFAGKGVQTFTTVLAVDSFGLGDTVGNTLLTAFFAAGALGVLAGGVLADRYAPARIIAGTLAVGAALLFVTVSGVVPSDAPLLVGLFGLIGFFVSLIAPARDQLVSDLSGAGSTGQSFGIAFTGGTIGSLSAPVLLGAVGDAASIALSFALVSAVYLLAGGLAFSLGRGWLIPTPGAATVDGD